MQVIWLNSDFWCSQFPSTRKIKDNEEISVFGRGLQCVGDRRVQNSGLPRCPVIHLSKAVTKGRRLVAPWSAEKGTTSSCFHSLISSGRLHSRHTGDLNPLQPVQKLSLKNVVCVDLTASLEGTKAVNRVSCWYREDYYSHRWVYMSKLLFTCWVELSDVFLNMEKLIQSHI